MSCDQCKPQLNGRVHMRAAEMEVFRARLRKAGSMTGRDWEAFRDGQAWPELLRPDYEFMLAHFYRPSPHYSASDELNHQRARATAVDLLCSQTDGRLRSLLARWHVMELEALVRILERPSTPGHKGPR